MKPFNMAASIKDKIPTCVLKKAMKMQVTGISVNILYIKLFFRDFASALKIKETIPL